MLLTVLYALISLKTLQNNGIIVRRQKAAVPSRPAFKDA
jgi:DNA-binding HxlR family transcriptional regulator